MNGFGGVPGCYLGCTMSTGGGITLPEPPKHNACPANGHVKDYRISASGTAYTPQYKNGRLCGGKMLVKCPRCGGWRSPYRES